LSRRPRSGSLACFEVPAPPGELVATSERATLPPVPDTVWTQQARDAALLDQLERRRYAHDQAQWQAPALTIAGQAFLLRVLADEGLEWWARAVVLAAGFLATLAAALSLRWLRRREVEYSRRITALSARVGFEDPRPPVPKRFPVINWWLCALVMFMAADAAVFVAAL
jgi:hypothetical protein